MKELKVVKEEGRNGEVIFRFEDTKIDIEKDFKGENSCGELLRRLVLILEGFKMFAESFQEENIKYQLTLGALITRPEKNLAPMEELLNHSERDETVTGVVILPAEAEAAVETEKVTKYVQKKLVADGFDANDSLFWSYASHAPITDEKGKPTTLDTQIQWAVSQTKQYYNSVTGVVILPAEAVVG